MILKCTLIFLLLQAFPADLVIGRHVISHSLHDISLGKLSPVDFTRNRSLLKRGRRCLGTALSLLWPQVVGPVDQGVIKESNYDEVPKTLLEYRLDMIRKKAQQEEETRLIIRDYMKKLTEAQDEFYGYPPNGNLLADYT